MGIDILYQDDHLIAVSKPAGQLTIPGRGQIPGDPLNIELGKLLKRPVFIVHRLDRGASGLVLFAKDAPTHRELNGQFEHRDVKKTYLVLVQGRVDGDGRVDQPIKAFGSGRMGVHPSGKPSQTDYKVLERMKEATLLEVSPLTGRRHQIRVHLYSIGHPVMGDTLYGKVTPVGGIERLMLHARTLAFVDPQGRAQALEADVPADFKSVLARLGSA